MLNTEARLAFISYGGSIDGKIAKLLCEFLCSFFPYRAAVYCTASNDNEIGAPYGEDFSNNYMENIRNARVFIPLLSENYLQSTTALIEMGAAYVLNKTFIPFLVSGCDYGKLQPLYNIRNRDMYDIDDFSKLRKALEKINSELDMSNSISEDKIKNFIQDIKGLKSEYRTNISKRKRIKFICSDLFQQREEYEDFIKKLKEESMLDICITKYVANKVEECRLYFKDSKYVSDLINYFDETGFQKNYSFVEIEG